MDIKDELERAALAKLNAERAWAGEHRWWLLAVAVAFIVGAFFGHVL